MIFFLEKMIRIHLFSISVTIVKLDEDIKIKAEEMTHSEPYFIYNTYICYIY